MPKKAKVLTKTLYTYVRPINRQWVMKHYKELGFASYSAYLDTLIEKQRVRYQQRKHVAETTRPAAGKSHE